MKFLLRHFVVFAFFFLSCSKKDQLSENKILLSGSSAGQKSWRLSVLSINDKVQQLDQTALNFTKTYYSNGVYADNDGMEGTWKMVSESDLLEVYNNVPSGFIAQSYSSIAITPNSLTLNYVSNGDKITAIFQAVN